MSKVKYYFHTNPNILPNISYNMDASDQKGQASTWKGKKFINKFQNIISVIFIFETS